MVPNPPAGGEESEAESQVAYFLAGEIDHGFSYKVLGACVYIFSALIFSLIFSTKLLKK